MTQAKLGSGARFRALAKRIAARGGVSNPAAVAASIGRKKYGTRRFQQLAAAGRKRSRDRGFSSHMDVPHGRGPIIHVYQ